MLVGLLFSPLAMVDALFNVFVVDSSGWLVSEES
jgi:hypothetical protein